jgi:hypothetical protein
MNYKIKSTKKSFMLKIILLAIFNIHNSHAGPTELALITVCNVPNIGLCIAKGISDYAPQMALTFFETGRAAEFMSQGPGVFVQAGMTMFNIWLSYKSLIYKKDIFLDKNDSTPGTLKNRNDFNTSHFHSLILTMLFFTAIQTPFLLYQQKLNTKSLTYAGIYSLINIIIPAAFLYYKKY